MHNSIERASLKGIRRMKASQYNIINMFSEDKGIAYNSYSGALVEISSEFCNILKQIESGKEQNILSEHEQEILSNMKRCGFIIDDVVDESAEFQKIIERQRKNEKALKLVIAPTLNCNFECPYCFEECRTGKMSDDVQDSIVRFVDVKLQNGAVQTVSVTWYGGEPLLEKNIIYSLADRLIDLCAKYNVDYTSSIITNGYLIDSISAEGLKNSKVKFAQITIDGDKDFHNRRRHLKGNLTDDTYDKIISGINILNSFGIRVSIRINVDSENNENIKKGISELSSRIKDKSKTSVYLGHVFDSEHNGYCQSTGCLSYEQFGQCRLDSAELIENSGFMKSIQNSYPRLRPNYCMATLQSSFVIGPYGEMYKCWNDIGHIEYSIGTTDTYTENQIASTEENSWLEYSPLDDEKCKSCGVLPICGGACPRDIVHSGKGHVCESDYYIVKDLMNFYYNKMKGVNDDGNNH